MLEARKFKTQGERFLAHTDDLPLIRAEAEVLGCDISTQPACASDFLIHLPQIAGARARERATKLASERAASAVWVEVRAKQDASRSRLLALWDRGTLVEFTPEWEWTQEEAEAFDNTRCDSCGVRHERKKVFVIEAHLPDGSVEDLQVGGSCADKYDCETSLRRFWKIAREGLKGLSGRVWDYQIDPDLALQLAWEVIAREGYISKARAQTSDVRATSSKVENAWYAVSTGCQSWLPDGPMGDELARALEHTDCPPDACKRALLFIDQEEDRRGWSDFLHNARECLLRGKPQWGHIAWLASELRKQHDAAPKASVRVQRITQPASIDPTLGMQDIPGCWEIISAREFDGQYGRSKLYVLVNSAGDGISFFSRDSAWKTGDVVRLRGKVKGLSRKGDCTELERVRIMDPDGDD